MVTSIPSSTLDRFTSFGELLRFLRRRARMTQMELSIAVGYSEPQISRLEQGLRLPDIPVIEARFIPALCLEDEPQAAARLLELAAKVRREDAPSLGLCPYKGLGYYDEADAELFVGREALVAKLAARLLSVAGRGQAGGDRFLVVVGASGSGKSSLVRAGLVPALRWDTRSANWSIHVLTPTAHPLESLATRLTQDMASVAATATLMDDLRRDSRSLSLHVKRGMRGGSPYLLLVVDQFEELFTLCRSEDERGCFIDNLLDAAAEPDGPTIVVITLRADFYPHCASYPRLREALPRQQEYIGAMSDEELRRAIEEPARRGRWELEPGLADLILHDVGHEPGALPLLSHALMETWQRRHGRTLTMGGYASSGGVRAAIAETAEAVFADQFTPEQQAIARRIFLRLTALADEDATGDTRRRATFTELILRPEEAAPTQAVLNALADARLVTTCENSVEVAHEALIREWPTLRGWLEENRDGLRLHRHLTETAQEWLASGRAPDLLYRGARLAQVREWAAGHDPDLNDQEREFLAASVADAEREAAEREASRQRELDAARRQAEAEKQRAEEQRQIAHRSRRQALLLAGSMALAVVLAAVAFWAWRQSVSDAAVSSSLLLASSAEQLNQAGQVDLALALAQEAVRAPASTGVPWANGNWQPPVAAVRALTNVALSPGTVALLAAPPGAGGSGAGAHGASAGAISPDGRLALSAGCGLRDGQGRCSENELILWDLAARKELHRWPPPAAETTAVAFAPDGRTALTGSADGTLTTWDVATGVPLRASLGHRGRITGIAVAKNYPAFLTGSDDWTMILWDLASGALIRRLEGADGQVNAVALDSSGRIALSGSEQGELALWDVRTGRLVKRLTGHTAAVNSVALSPDGSRVLSINKDLYLRLWDSQTGEILKAEIIPCRPERVVLGPEAKTALLNCAGFIYFWDVEAWREVRRFVSDADINALDISADGSLGLSAAADGLRLWRLRDQLDYQTVETGLAGGLAIAAHPDGKHLLIGSDPPVLWDVAARQAVQTYPGFTGQILPGALAVSPDGRYLAGAGGDFPTDARSLLIWDVRSGAVVCRLEGHAATPRSVAFSPDGHSLLAGSQNPEDRSGDLILWDAQTCRIIRRFETTSDVAGIAFSADGSRAITGQSYSPQATLWDVATGREIRRFVTDRYPQATFPVLDVAFGPGGRTVLGSSVGGLYLWDVESGQILRRFRGHAGLAWSLDVSPDGRYAISAADSGEVILWDFATGQELYRLNASKQAVYSVSLSPDGRSVFSLSILGQLVEWPIREQSLEELLAWIPQNRYVQPLTCEERTQYRVKPPCPAPVGQ